MNILLLENERESDSPLLALVQQCWPGGLILTKTCRDALTQINGPRHIPILIAEQNLTDGTGLDLIQVGHNRGLLAFTHSMLTTAFPDRATVIRAKAVGLGQFLVKPLKSDYLLNALTQTLERIQKANQFNKEADAWELLELKAFLEELTPATINERLIQELVAMAGGIGWIAGVQASIRIRPYLGVSHRKQLFIELALHDLKQNFELVLSWQHVAVAG